MANGYLVAVIMISIIGRYIVEVKLYELMDEIHSFIPLQQSAKDRASALSRKRKAYIAIYEILFLIIVISGLAIAIRSA